MQDLKVIGVENGALLAASDDGERYRIAIDEVLQSRLRQNKPEPQTGPKISPREVQAHIRSGMTADEVSTVTGAPLEYVQRFEGPIMAEREHIVSSALGVAVHTSGEVDVLGEPANFGSVIRERLASLSASGERWAAWKEQEGGWNLKLSFTADQIDHDARWSYDPRKHSLSPLNSEATTLSQQGELQGGLIPRLRAVAPASAAPDESRFDSGAFTFTEESSDTGPHLEPVPYGRTTSASNNAITVTAIKRSHDEVTTDQHQTADLLEALRKRRGEREAAGYEDHTPAAIDVPLDDFDSLEDAPAPKQQATNSGTPRQSAGAGKKGRTSMPSWDEIVFGARSDDDLA